MYFFILNNDFDIEILLHQNKQTELSVGLKC